MKDQHQSSEVSAHAAFLGRELSKFAGRAINDALIDELKGAVGAHVPPPTFDVRVTPDPVHPDKINFYCQEVTETCVMRFRDPEMRDRFDLPTPFNTTYEFIVYEVGRDVVKLKSRRLEARLERRNGCEWWWNHVIMNPEGVKKAKFEM